MDTTLGEGPIGGAIPAYPSSPDSTVMLCWDMSLTAGIMCDNPILRCVFSKLDSKFSSWS